MTDLSTVVDYKDDLILAGCEFRWSKGDKFALIEAIAICAARDLSYPKWVRTQIDAAMIGIFKSVFPDQNLEASYTGLGISYLPEGTELAELKDRFEHARREASKTLCLASNVHVLQTHINAIRDFHLAELVGRLAVFVIDPSPQFKGVTKVKNDLYRALNLTRDRWEEVAAADGELAVINGQSLRIRAIPPICRMATFDVIDDAWDAYKEFILAERISLYEDTHGVNLSE